MEDIIIGVNWVAVGIGAVAAFALGWLWYSDTLFGAKWRTGLGTPARSWPMWMPMVAQAIATLLLAWVVGVTETTGSLTLAILLAITIAAIVKAQGLFNGKSRYAIGVDAGYIIAMVAIMVLAHILF